MSVKVLENKADKIRKNKKWDRHGKTDVEKWLERRRQSDIKSGSCTALIKIKKRGIWVAQ